MFGYVKAYQPELRIKEYEFYKAVYCALCRDLGRQYGLISRFSLSYDFTFLALLYLSLREGRLSTNRKRCVCNPCKACQYLEEGDMPQPVVAAAEIMLYAKLEDNIADEGFWKAGIYRLLRAFSKKGYRKAAARYPELVALFDCYLAEQREVETANLQNLDAAADPTARMLSRLFAFCAPEEETRALERLGYCMGRWIYLMDVAADLPDDLRKKRYNPLADEAKGQSDLTAFVKERLGAELNVCVKEAAAAFELLDIWRLKNILGNIIYLGLEESQKQIFSKEKQKT